MNQTHPIRAILLDIEGTTTPIDFVYKVLFPYARDHVTEFLTRNAGDLEVQQDIEALRRDHALDVEQGFMPPELPAGAPAAVANYVRWLVDQDRKSTALKSLQGKIWAEGYGSGALRSRVFDDVPSALERWSEQKKTVAIFSSGSVLGQKLLFKHSEAGDLTAYLSGYFDTTTGAKTDPVSYQKIASSLRQPPAAILFISDAVKELDAAQKAGLETLLADRPGNHPQPPHSYCTIQTFDGVSPNDK